MAITLTKSEVNDILSGLRLKINFLRYEKDDLKIRHKLTQLKAVRSKLGTIEGLTNKLRSIDGIRMSIKEV